MSLTPLQEEAARSTQCSVAVIASAGSGKTRVLIERYRHLIQEDAIPPYRILAFTFTEKAAAEIRERVLRQGVLRPAEEALLQIGTIHAFASRLLRAHGHRLGLDPEFAISNETEAAILRSRRLNEFLLDHLKRRHPAVARLTERFGFKRLTGLFDELARDVLLDDGRLLKSLEDPIERALAALSREFAAQWESEKLKRGLLDFDDLERLAVRLLKESPEIRKSLQRRYRHVMVDEMQDTSPLQGELIDCLFEPGTNHLFVVGDPKQSIYRFRGADIGVFRRILDRIRDSQGKILSLDTTFRMPPRLTGVMNRVFKPLFAEGSATVPFNPMNSPLPDGGHFTPVIVGRDKTPIDDLRRLEARFIAATLKRLALPPEELSGCAILFRAGMSMEIYRQELQKQGIPCRISHTTHLLKAPEVRDLVHLLAYLSGDRNRIVLAGILRSPAFGLSENFIEHFLAAKPTSFTSPFTPDLFLSHDDQTRWGRLLKLINRWEGLKSLLSPSSLFREIMRDLDLFRARGNERLNLEHWLQLLEDLESRDAPDLAALHRTLRTVEEQGETIRTLDVKDSFGAVHLMTVHASKGLEFRRVFLPQIYARGRSNSWDFLAHPELGLSFKREPSELTGLKVQLEETPLFERIKEREEAELREESKRLLYVAMTRAREELYVFLKEPAKEKVGLEEAKDWNEWLWCLLEEEKRSAIFLNDADFKSVDPVPELPVIERAKPSDGGDQRQDQRRLRTRDTPSYTVSSIESYLRCQKEYELKYVYGIEALKASETPGHFQFASASPHHPAGRISASGAPGAVSPANGLPSSKWGILIHEVLQFLDFNTLANAQTVIDQALTNQRLNDPEGSIRQAVHNLIKSLTDRPDIIGALSNTQEHFNEMPFVFRHGHFAIRGTLDRLMKKEAGWMVLDYKTDRLRSEEDAVEKEKMYWGQLACYALATSRILGLSEVKTALLFTDGPYLRVQHWDEAALQDAGKRLIELEANLRGGDFRYPENRTICHLCSYWERDYCGIRKQASSG